MKITDWLRLPEKRVVKGMDDHQQTLLHAEILKDKPFLRNLYRDFYKELSAGTAAGPVVELGSGAGFIKEIIPSAVTSDVLELPGLDKVFSATDMPFDDGSIGGFVMINVLHHISRPREFFAEALRCLKAGGRVAMIEPANTLWSRFIYKNFHHELFDEKAEWALPPGGPLAIGNDAMPWIIFCRDRAVFEKEFPLLRVVSVKKHTPLCYFLSGGFTQRQMLPSFMYPFIRFIERLLSPLSDWLGMFQTIQLQKSQEV